MGLLSSKISKEVTLVDDDPKTKYEQSIFTAFPETAEYLVLESVNGEDPGQGFLYDTMCCFVVSTEDGKNTDLDIEYIVQLDDDRNGMSKMYEICISYGDVEYDGQYIKDDKGYKLYDKDYGNVEAIRRSLTDLHINITKENVNKFLRCSIIENIPEDFVERISEKVTSK